MADATRVLNMVERTLEWAPDARALLHEIGRVLENVDIEPARHYTPFRPRRGEHLTDEAALTATVNAFHHCDGWQLSSALENILVASGRWVDE